MAVLIRVLLLTVAVMFPAASAWLDAIADAIGDAGY